MNKMCDDVLVLGWISAQADLSPTVLIIDHHWSKVHLSGSPLWSFYLYVVWEARCQRSQSSPRTPPFGEASDTHHGRWHLPHLHINVSFAFRWEQCLKRPNGSMIQGERETGVKRVVTGQELTSWILTFLELQFVGYHNNTSSTGLLI